MRRLMRSLKPTNSKLHEKALTYDELLKLRHPGAC